MPEGQFGAIEESKRETIEGRGEKVGSRDGRQGRGCIVGEDNDKFNSQIRRRRRERPGKHEEEGRRRRQRVVVTNIVD